MIEVPNRTESCSLHSHKGNGQGCRSSSHDAPDKVDAPGKITVSLLSSDTQNGPLEQLLQPQSKLPLLHSNWALQPVDWRWQLGLYLAPGSRTFPEKWQTDPVRHARTFVTRLQRCSTGDDYFHDELSPEAFSPGVRTDEWDCESPGSG